MELLTKKVEWEVTLYDDYDHEWTLNFDTRGKAKQFINKRDYPKWRTWRMIKITTTVEKEIL